jgi:hypothetical protein
VEILNINATSGFPTAPRVEGFENTTFEKST